jgi:putative hydrolase of the HAD superfamily
VEIQKETQPKVTNIVIDLTNVLFLINVKGILKSIGIWNLCWYVLTKWKNPETVSFKFLEALHYASPPQYPLISYKNYKLPDCITANLLGYITTQEVWATIKQAIHTFASQNYFQDAQEKQIIAGLMENMFNLDRIKENMRPNEQLIRLLQNIKNKPYKLFLLTNVGHDTYDALKQTYPEVFTLFDGRIISAEVKQLKPYPPIYHTLINTYQLSPEESVFIDDQQDNIDAARIIGFNGITYHNYRTLEKELAKLGID